MKNQFIYLAAIALFSIGLGGCTKDELNSEDDHCEASFFDHQVQDEALSVIIDSLIVRDQNQNFTNHIALEYGYPSWHHFDFVANEYVREYRVPLVKRGEKEVNTIWVFIETYNNVRIKILNKNNDMEIIADQDWEFSYMTEKIFGFKDKPKFIKEKRQTKGLVYGEITECYRQVALVNGYENDSMLKCRTTFGYRYVDGQLYEQMGPLQRPGNEDFSVGKGGGSSGPGTPPGPRPLPKVKEDPSFKTNPCASSILFSLKTGQSTYKYDESSNKFIPDNNLTESILKFFNKSKRFDITYSIGSLPSDVAGNCDKIDKKWKSYKITLNEDYVGKATDLSIARTLIHETIHAHLNYITKSLPYSEQLKSNEWHALNEIYNNIPYKKKDKLAKTHHEYMAGIANLISNCLYDWANANNKNITRAYCSNLAWAGLQKTNTFKEKVKKRELNKAEIKRNLLSEQENYPNSKGQACKE